MILQKGEQRALLTGATGLIGASIASHLVELGFESEAEPFVKASRRADYLNLSETILLVEQLRPNIVINCAAKRPQSNLGARPSPFFNHQMVLNLVQALENLEHEVHFIQFGSAAEYSPTSETISETSECKPSSSYGQDKVLSTNFLMALDANSVVKPVVLRPSTVYGREQSPDMLIPMLRKAVSSGDRVTITNPWDERDFLHVEDLAKACACVIGNTQSRGEVFNVSTGRPRTVQALLQSISSITGRPVESFAIVGDERLQPQTSLNLPISAQKFMARHNWTASIDLERGLRELFSRTEGE